MWEAWRPEIACVWLQDQCRCTGAGGLCGTGRVGLQRRQGRVGKGLLKCVEGFRLHFEDHGEVMETF